MELFTENDIRGYFTHTIASLNQEVQREGADRLLNVDEEQYLEYLTQKYSIDIIEFRWDDVYLTQCEKSISAGRFPSGFHVTEGKKYPKQVVTFHVPISGEWTLLRCRPTSWLTWSVEAEADQNEVTFDVVNWRDNGEEIRKEYEATKSNITHHAESINKDVIEFNENLPSRASAIVAARKKEHLARLNTLEAIGVPIRKSKDTPATFSAPAIKKKTLIKKPPSSDKPFNPEPALCDETYRNILKICHEVGIEMERHPSTYAGKDEETLRDHFLMILDTHFESVTGETFNRNGKTDILIRHEKSNVFVGECKFWRGEKSLIKTIDQLLGYLTWRDSKAAVLMFIQNKQLDPVLEKIVPTVEQHECYVKTLATQNQGWTEFKLHLLNDPTRSVSLSVLCFHIPKM